MATPRATWTPHHSRVEPDQRYDPETLQYLPPAWRHHYDEARQALDAYHERTDDGTAAQ